MRLRRPVPLKPMAFMYQVFDLKPFQADSISQYTEVGHCISRTAILADMSWLCGISLAKSLQPLHDQFIYALKMTAFDFFLHKPFGLKIGRASCRERVSIA